MWNIKTPYKLHFNCTLKNLTRFLNWCKLTGVATSKQDLLELFSQRFVIRKFSRSRCFESFFAKIDPRWLINIRRFLCRTKCQANVNAMLRVFLELLDILQFSCTCSDCSDAVKLSNKGVGTKEEKLKRSIECNVQWVLPSKDSAALDPHAVFPFSFSPSFQIAIYRSTPHLSPCLPPGRFHW